MLLEEIVKGEPDWGEKVNAVIRSVNNQTQQSNLLYDGCFEVNSLNKRDIDTSFRYLHDIWMSKATSNGIRIMPLGKASEIEGFSDLPTEQFIKATGSKALCLHNTDSSQTITATLMQIVDIENINSAIKLENLAGRKVTFSLSRGGAATDCSVVAKIIINDGDVLASKEISLDSDTAIFKNDSITAQLPAVFENLRVEIVASILPKKSCFINQCKLEIGEKPTAYSNLPIWDTVKSVGSLFQVIEKKYGCRNMGYVFHETVDYRHQMSTHYPTANIYPLDSSVCKEDSYGNKWYDCYPDNTGAIGKVSYSTVNGALTSALSKSSGSTSVTAGSNSCYVVSNVYAGTFYHVTFRLTLDARPYL